MEAYSSCTDEYLFSLLKDDDERAFNELYNRYWKKLFIRAKIFLHSQEDAEEVVHDVFVRLWRKRASIEIIYSFHTYIAAMLRYTCLKVLAKRRLQHVKETVVGELHLQDLSTQEWIEFDQLREELEKAVCQLPEKCQLIFRLSREQHLTDKEIAQKLELSTNTVRTQMHRALQKLKVSINTFFLL